MKKTKIEGWLFDVDELGSGMALWIYDAGGKLHRLTHEFSPPIYVSGARDELKRLSSDLWRRGLVTGGRWEKRREFWTGEEIEVLRLNVSDSSNLSSFGGFEGDFDRRFSFFNLEF